MCKNSSFCRCWGRRGDEIELLFVRITGIYFLFGYKRTRDIFKAEKRSVFLVRESAMKKSAVEFQSFFKGSKP